MAGKVASATTGSCRLARGSLSRSGHRAALPRWNFCVSTIVLRMCDVEAPNSVRWNLRAAIAGTCILTAADAAFAQPEMEQARPSNAALVKRES
jgi:hypothetical protein